MSRIIEVESFGYMELSDAAKAKARDWYTGDSNFFDSESVIEDAADIADILGIDLRQTRKTRIDNSTYYAPSVYWSGFWSQGDGASFDCRYAYKKGAAKAIRKECPTDKKLHAIADALQAAQKPVFYSASASTRVSGRSVNSGCMSVSVEIDKDFSRKVYDECEGDITEALRDFADWIYYRLRDEYEYQTSEDAIVEAMAANEYEFTEDGAIA